MRMYIKTISYVVIITIMTPKVLFGILHVRYKTQIS